MALSQFKSDKAREIGDLQTSLHRKDVEIRNMKKKCHDIETKLKSVSSDFAASNTIHEQEMKKVKAAHSKSLEMLMSYQEENDLLRSTVRWSYHGVASGFTGLMVVTNICVSQMSDLIGKDDIGGGAGPSEGKAAQSDTSNSSGGE